jgi:outer membrane protein OmpU
MGRIGVVSNETITPGTPGIPGTAAVAAVAGALTAAESTAADAAAATFIQTYGQFDALGALVFDDTGVTALTAAEAATAAEDFFAGFGFARALPAADPDEGWIVDSVSVGNVLAARADIADVIANLTAAANASQINTWVAADVAAASGIEVPAAIIDADGNITTADALAYLQANQALIDQVLAAASGTAAVAAVAAVPAVPTTASTDTTIDTRVQFDLRGSTQADNGMTFGGWIRMRGTSGNTTLNGPRVTVGYGDLTIYGGNIPGPLDAMANVYGYTVGYTGGTFQGLVNQADTMAFTSTGAGANGLQIDYSANGLSVSAATQPSNDNMQASITYTSAGLTVAVGAQFSDRAAEDETVVTLGYTMGNIGMALASSDNNGNRKSTLSMSANTGTGMALAAYISDDESQADNGYGIGLTYDLGGATFGAAYEKRFNTSDRIEAGLTFSF